MILTSYQFEDVSPNSEYMDVNITCIYYKGRVYRSLNHFIHNSFCQTRQIIVRCILLKTCSYKFEYDASIGIEVLLFNEEYSLT
jgi:hypothetical protein